MLSTCPECRTTFRVGQEQLDAKRGLVRCGRCRAVFNAYDTLLPELEAPPAEAEDGIPAPLTTGEAEALAVQEAALAEPIMLSAEPEPEPEPRIERREGIAAYEAVAAEAKQAEAPPLRWTLREGEETPESILLSELPVRRASSSSSLRPLWMVLLIPLVLLLPLQLTYFLRAEVAAWLPQARPYLEAACEPLGCVVALPRDREALRVESSSLETDPESPATAQLRLAFSNRAEQTMAWPHIVLTLTDVRDAPVAQRVFAPGEYLPKQQATRPGLEAGQEYEAWLDLDLNGLVAAGYRVVLEYP